MRPISLAGDGAPEVKVCSLTGLPFASPLPRTVVAVRRPGSQRRGWGSTPAGTADRHTLPPAQHGPAVRAVPAARVLARRRPVPGEQGEDCGRLEVGDVPYHEPVRPVPEVAREA